MSKHHVANAFPYCDPLQTVSAAVHHDIQQFLFRKALLLDQERYEEWTALIARDIRYRVPRGFARAPNIKTAIDSPYSEDDYESLIIAIQHLRESTRPTSAEDGSETLDVRRLVTNVIVCPRNCGEYDVLSYLLVTRGCLTEGSGFLLTAERRDQLRCGARSFNIFRREITIDRYASALRAVNLLL